MPPLTAHHQIPHLTTATSGPLRYLEKVILDEQITIETWFRERWQKTPAPITSSVDLRNAGFKLAPVDTNLFPAGFNNLNRDFLPLCIQAAQSSVVGTMPGCRKILLVPESHTRNPFYLESLATIQEIFCKAGFDVRIGSLLEDLTAPRELSLDSGKTLTLEPIIRDGDQIAVADFNPCLILLNNDLSDGVPEILQGIEQRIRPSSQLGWGSRLKSGHFAHYQAVANEFSELLNIDPWLITPEFSTASDIDFMKREGEEHLADEVNQLLKQIGDKYKQYDINQPPFVVVKADAGTYGMGIMMVRDAAQLQQLNRKQRTKLSASKGSQKVSKVIIQEGVYTFEKWQQEAVAEPVVYMMGQYVVGGFYRVHKGKGRDDNLNAPGMHFEPLAFEEACNNPARELSPEECPNRFYAYGVIARLAALAAAAEIAGLES